MEYILEVRHLVKTFPEVKAVNDISFAIEPGICFGLLGPNGAGKTTTIEVIEGISPKTSGEIYYKDKEELDGFHEQIGVQLQNTELPLYLTVGETLATFRNLYTNKTDLDELINICRLSELLKRDNRKISGGQKQRLLLALALANNPELIFLDEPTTGLDPQARRLVWEIISNIKKHNKTIVLTTHYMEEAQILCDKIAIMDRGKIIAMGPPEELLKQHLAGTKIIINNELPVEKLNELPCRIFRVEDHFEIQTNSVNECIKALIDAGIDLSEITVRSLSLEDLFLELTGRDIRN